MLIAEEALSPRTVELLAGALERQPPWSDLPLVVFAAPMDRQASSARLDWMSERLGNVTLVERPVRVATLVTAVRAALRARHRQYAARATMKALEAREEELKLAGERKDEFLAMLAHELRNPWPPSRMALELLELGGNEPVRAARNQAIARRQLGHLVRLVDDLLDVSRITRGSFELRKSELDLNKVLDDALSVAQPLLETRGILLTVDRPMAPVPVHADSTRLEQVLTNLLSNSAKFTESGGAVVVSLVQTDHQAVLRVHDTGRGIPARMTDQVFEPFVQVNPGLDRSKGGLGLGLTLVKRLVQMHGGTVTASSGGTGQGSTFEVRLPLRLGQHGAKTEGARTGESAPRAASWSSRTPRTSGKRSPISSGRSAIRWSSPRADPRAPRSSSRSSPTSDWWTSGCREWTVTRSPGSSAHGPRDVPCSWWRSPATEDPRPRPRHGAPDSTFISSSRWMAGSCSRSCGAAGPRLRVSPAPRRAGTRGAGVPGSNGGPEAASRPTRTPPAWRA